MTMANRIARYSRRGGLVVPGASNRGRFPQGQRLSARGLLAAAETQRRILEQERQAALFGEEQVLLQARFRDRGLQALFARARRTTPIDTGRLRSSMRLQVARFTATLSWNTPYAVARQYMRRVPEYVERCARAGVGSANMTRPRGLTRRIRDFHWQGRNTIIPDRYVAGKKKISTRITIPPAPRGMRGGEPRARRAYHGRRARTTDTGTARLF